MDQSGTTPSSTAPPARGAGRPVQHLRVGDGHADLDPATGAVTRFHDPRTPQRVYLLDSALHPWHSLEHAWGSGHLQTSTGSARWNTPTRTAALDDGVHLRFDTPLGLSLEVERRGGERLRETYVLRNTTTEPVTVTGVGIQVPFADVYHDARTALETAVHAHVFTGGSWAWVLAQPMSGTGRCLGLVVRQGSLAAYSIESRNHHTLSNVRGHLVLHPTDAARNPAAFGGQPHLQLAAGATWTLSWDVGWYDDPAGFLQDTHPAAHLERLSAPVGVPLPVRTQQAVSSPTPGVRIEPTDDGALVHARQPGPVSLQIGTARTEVAFHQPLPEVVRRRARYITEHQRAVERPGDLAAAFVPVDTRNLLTQNSGGWADWSDGSERIGMAALLQQGLLRGWLDEDAYEPVVAAWAAFARRHLVDAEGLTRRGSTHPGGPRLYDVPWLAHFFTDRFRWSGREADLELAATLLEAQHAHEPALVPPIGGSEATVAVADALSATGQDARAHRLRRELLVNADDLLVAGRDLPASEVNYEQSIVAPLVNLLVDAHRLTGEDRYLDGIAERLPWLLAFGGPQPHVRLRDVAIRHWDGFWFGADRLWGDVFPHYWSALTAQVLLRLPRPLRTAGGDAAARSLLAANLLNQHPDGGATCAFVFPSSVDGRPAHRADPLANDQDWHLVVWMRLAEELGAAEVAADGTSRG
ncbi:hypothetical protein [Kineococcus sp. G2]|uniref:hypothetical protein n=1 Tax=Kineococcus sp. G2 TaxID=3127484 RepID=UPI00301B7494